MGSARPGRPCEEQQPDGGALQNRVLIAWEPPTRSDSVGLRGLVRVHPLCSAAQGPVLVVAVAQALWQQAPEREQRGVRRWDAAGPALGRSRRRSPQRVKAALAHCDGCGGAAAPPSARGDTAAALRSPGSAGASAAPRAPCRRRCSVGCSPQDTMVRAPSFPSCQPGREAPRLGPGGGGGWQRSGMTSPSAVCAVGGCRAEAARTGFVLARMLFAALKGAARPGRVILGRWL